jgi:benzodiazapine receptor
MKTLLRNQWLVLAGFIALCLMVGALGGMVTSGAIDNWYRPLVKPTWTPPDWLFAPAWTTLYIMMAVAAWLVWRTQDRIAPAMLLFFSQLALNFAWSFLFFGARSPWLGLIDITLLWLAILFTMLAFFGRSKLAGWLFVPYLAWVSFASALNFTIWRLN